MGVKTKKCRQTKRGAERKNKKNNFKKYKGGKQFFNEMIMWKM